MKITIFVNRYKHYQLYEILKDIEMLNYNDINQPIYYQNKQHPLTIPITLDYELYIQALDKNIIREKP